MLVSRHAIMQPPGLKKLVMVSPASMELWAQQQDKHHLSLSADVQAILTKHEEAGTTDSKEYKGALGSSTPATFVCWTQYRERY